MTHTRIRRQGSTVTILTTTEVPFSHYLNMNAPPVIDTTGEEICDLCRLTLDECSCADCAVGPNVVLLPEYAEGEAGQC